MSDWIVPQISWLGSLGHLKDPSDRETNDIAAANNLSRTPLWRKHLEMYPGTHTKTPKGNLSREVAFRNVGKDLSDNNESYRVWRQASDYENNGCSNRNPSGQLILALSVKLTIRLSTTKPQLLEFHSYPTHKFPNLKSVFPPFFSCNWSGKFVSILKRTILKTSEDSSRCATWLSNAASLALLPISGSGSCLLHSCYGGCSFVPVLANRGILQAFKMPGVIIS